MNVPVVLLSITVAILSCLAIWSHLRLRRLTRVVETLAAGSDAKDMLAKRWQFRFSLRSMFVLMTVVAIVLGLFGSELYRARMQRDALDSIEAELGGMVQADYRMGWLGDGQFAGLFCIWIHSDWGCRTRNLSISADTQRTRLTAQNARSLGNVSSLEGLQLIGLDLTQSELAALSQMPHLRRLSLVGCSLSEDAVEHIAKCESLEHLELYNCGLTGMELHPLSELTSVMVLDLSRNPLVDVGLESIGKMKNLSSLDLDNTLITDDGLRQLSSLQNLERLSLCDTELTDAGVRHLVVLPKLYDLALLSTHITLDCVDSLKQLKHLKKLWARGYDSTNARRDELFRDNLPTVEIINGYETPHEDLEWSLDDNRPYYHSGPSYGPFSGSTIP